MNANNLSQTISGIVPVESDQQSFHVSTAKAEAFLQKKFTSMIARMNQAIKQYNDEHPDEEPQPYEEDIEVNLITTRMSSKFYPFLLVLPSSVLKDKNRAKKMKNELDIFNPNHTEHSANMKDPLYQIIKSFMYDDRDRDAFFSPTVQHELKISSRTAGNIKANCRLKLHSFDKGRATYVTVLLDPLRLFYNMTTPVGGIKKPYRIEITKVEQIKGGNFGYQFNQIFKTKNGKNKKNTDIERQILQIVTGRN